MCLSEKVGDALRNLATTIDGRWSLAIYFITDPVLTKSTQAKLINQGINAMDKNINEAVKIQAIDDAVDSMDCKDLNYY